MDVMVGGYVCFVDNKYLSSIKKAQVDRRFMIFPKIGAHQIDISVGQLAFDEFKLAEFILAMIKLRSENREEKLNDRLLM